MCHLKRPLFTASRESSINPKFPRGYCCCSDLPCGHSFMGTLCPNFLDSTANLRLVHWFALIGLCGNILCIFAARSKVQDKQWSTVKGKKEDTTPIVCGETPNQSQITTLRIDISTGSNLCKRKKDWKQKRLHNVWCFPTPWWEISSNSERTVLFSISLIVSEWQHSTYLSSS